MWEDVCGVCLCVCLCVCGFKDQISHHFFTNEQTYRDGFPKSNQTR